METTAEKLDQLASEEKAACEAHRVARERLKQAQVAAIGERYGVTVGCILAMTDPHDREQVWRISGIEPNSYFDLGSKIRIPATLYGHKQTARGFHSVEMYISQWPGWRILRAADEASTPKAGAASAVTP